MKNTFFLVLLVYFAPLLPTGSFASASDFHKNLPENKREEITIVDDFTVKVGLGPDQQSVSCTILDAVSSLPSIDGAMEPEVVYVNKEMVHHIRKGLYTWDRAGKYRVRLTTKYIREFGDILIRVPDPNALQPVIEESKSLSSSFYQSLPENKQEEITIIDPYMVEVGLGPDLRVVESNIQDAIQSIPAVEEEGFPEFVSVNGEPIFFIGNGLYSWDSDGSNPVRLTTPFIKKFGNIRVSIPGEPPAPPKEKPPAVVLEKKKSTTTSFKQEKPKKAAKAPAMKPASTPRETEIPKEEVIAKAHVPSKIIKREPLSPVPTRKKVVGLKGFRLAHFGMDISQVKKAIQDDFSIEDSLIKVTGQSKNIIAISTNKLSEKGEIASVQYLFTIKDKKLIRIHVIWEPSENTDNLAAKLTRQFSSSKFLKSQTTGESDQLYSGKDSHGNELKLSWVKNPTGNSLKNRPLSLSYLAFIPEG